MRILEQYVFQKAYHWYIPIFVTIDQKSLFDFGNLLESKKFVKQ